MLNPFCKKITFFYKNLPEIEFMLKTILNKGNDSPKSNV